MCGFRIGDNLLGPLTAKTTPFPLYVTDGPSLFEVGWLEINKDQALDQFYDDAVRSEFGLKSMKIYRDAAKLVVEEFDGSQAEISLNRTLRVPEDGTVYNLPALFGPFPLLNVDLMRDRLPEPIVRKSGLLIPMFQREALSIGFNLVQNRNWPGRTEKERMKYAARLLKTEKTTFAIKILAGSVNAISGAIEGGSRNRSGEQDYIVAPYQKRLDGFFSKAGVNIVRQFVAMPVFAGYTAEGQLKGVEEVGGIQLIIAPRFAGRGEFRSAGPSGQCLSMEQQSLSPVEMSLGPGDILFVSGSDLEERFQDAFCLGESDALCTGPDFFISENSAVTLQRYRSGDARCVNPYPYPDGERPVMMHEFLAAAVHGDHQPDEPLVLEPVFRMKIIVRSRHSRDFLPAKGRLQKGRTPKCLGFGRDNSHDNDPVVVAWHVSPFMSLQQLYLVVRAKFKCENVALFRGNQQVGTDGGDYTALHNVLEDGAVVWFQAYWPIFDLILHTLGSRWAIESAPRISDAPAKSVSPWELGLAPGGQVYQDICVDSELGWWNWKRSRLVNIQILNATSFRSFTGIDAPQPPLSFQDYVDARLPFFHLLPQASALAGSEILAKLKSVGENDLEAGVENRDSLLSKMKPVGCLVCQTNLADSV